MATGLKPVTSNSGDGSVFIVAGEITGASGSGDGWSAADGSTGVYTIALTQAFSSILYAHADIRASVADSNEVGAVFTAYDAAAGTVSFTLVSDRYTQNPATGVDATTSVALHFVIVASHYGK